MLQYKCWDESEDIMAKINYFMAPKFSIVLLFWKEKWKFSVTLTQKFSAPEEKAESVSHIIKVLCGIQSGFLILFSGAEELCYSARGKGDLVSSY